MTAPAGALGYGKPGRSVSRDARRPHLVTDPERELRLLGYGEAGRRRNAKLIALGSAAFAACAGSGLSFGASPLLGISLFVVGWLLTLLVFWLDDFLP